MTIIVYHIQKGITSTRKSGHYFFVLSFSDTFKLFIKIFIRQICASFQTFIIHNPAFNGVALHNTVCPFTKLYCSFVIHFESNGNNHMQVIMICFSLHLTRALCLNYSELPNSCRLIQFAVSIYFFDMLVDCRQSNIIKCSHHLLRQPYILILITHFNAIRLISHRGNISQIFRRT